MGCLLKFVIRFNILSVKNVVLQIALIMTLKRSKLIHIILCLLKILTFQNAIILLKSVVNKNENKYYYNILLEKGSYKYKSHKQYFKMNVCIL